MELLINQDSWVNRQQTKLNHNKYAMKASLYFNCRVDREGCGEKGGGGYQGSGNKRGDGKMAVWNKQRETAGRARWW